MVASPPKRLPHGEAARLDAVRRHDILDTPPDGAFDRVTAIAARVCGAPISTITIVDEDRIWFKSAHGIEVDEIGRDPGLCASAILQDGPYVVHDAVVDPRTLDNPLVRGELGLRYYVAVPLTTAEGYRLGTLNVIDVEPRAPTPEQLATLTDLAELVTDQLELRLTARRTIQLEGARAATRLRDSLLRGLSHEMRTPLALLRGLTELSDEAALGEEEQPEALRDMLRRQVRHLDWLVNQFLDFTRIEDARPLGLRPEPVELIDLVRDACDVFADRAAIVVEQAPGTPAAMADPHRTGRVVTELINNARRFGGSETPIHVRVEGDGETVRLTVADHGPGIDPSDRAHLFDRLYRDTRSTGSGVGLYVSRIHAEAQGGHIEVDSAPGQGSRFTLVLPTALDEARAPEATSAC